MLVMVEAKDNGHRSDDEERLDTVDLDPRVLRELEEVEERKRRALIRLALLERQLLLRKDEG